jgi:hypothetical protein
MIVSLDGLRPGIGNRRRPGHSCPGKKKNSRKRLFFTSETHNRAKSGKSAYRDVFQISSFSVACLERESPGISDTFLNI